MGVLPLRSENKIDLVHLENVIETDICAIHKSIGSFSWRQIEHSLWWQKLGYETETQARSNRPITRNRTRNYSVSVSETEHFDVYFHQLPQHTNPTTFIERLSFVLKKDAWEMALGDKLELPHAYLFSDDLTNEKSTYLLSPKIRFERTLGDEPHILVLLENMYLDYLREHKETLKEVPKIEFWFKTILNAAFPDDMLFGVRSLDDKVLKSQLIDFKNNLACAYGVAKATRVGVYVNRINRGI